MQSFRLDLEVAGLPRGPVLLVVFYFGTGILETSDLKNLA